VKRFAFFLFFVFVLNNSFATGDNPAQSNGNLINTTVATEVESIVRDKILPLAELLNRVMFEAGLIGVADLVDSCYYAPRYKGYDCFILDLGGRALDSVLSKNLRSEFFANEVHAERVNAAIQAGYYKLEDVRRISDVVVPRIREALLADVQKKDYGSRDKCIVVDADIAGNFSGECIDNYAEGYGVAKGRDEYRGDFKKGEAHGKGQYSHGSQSRWSTEVFRGSYFRGAKNGFGVLSISANSNHPATDSMQKHGEQRDGRYYLAAMYSAGNRILLCQTEDECLKKIPTLTFTEVEDQVKFGGGAVNTEELRKLVTKGVLFLKGSKSFTDCVSSEATYEFFGRDSVSKTVELLELKGFYNYLTNQRLIVQPYLYCLRK
jgi:hypothetical protein